MLKEPLHHSLFFEQPNMFPQCQVWDASKSVGKIEGYQVKTYSDRFPKIFTLEMQELTNKLQRYLNQRFMLDSDQVE